MSRNIKIKVSLYTEQAEEGKNWIENTNDNLQIIESEISERSSISQKEAEGRVFLVLYIKSLVLFLCEHFLEIFHELYR